MGRYSKFIGTIVGAVIGMALMWVAVQFPSVAECTVGPNGVDACSVFGFGQAEITALVVTLLGSLGTYFAPPNAP